VRVFERGPWRQDVPLVVEVRVRTPSLDTPGLRVRAVKTRGCCPGRSSSEQTSCMNSGPGQESASHVSGNSRLLRTPTGVAVNVLFATCRGRGLRPGYRPRCLSARKHELPTDTGVLLLFRWPAGMSGLSANWRTLTPAQTLTPFGIVPPRVVRRLSPVAETAQPLPTVVGANYRL
jgi:hypothetical protein